MASSKPLPPKTEAASKSGASTSEPSTSQVARPGGRCPICTAPTEAKFRPFCSSRCADVDLSRWLRGGYAIAGRADVDEDGDDSTAANQTRLGPSRDEDDDA